MGSRVIRSIGRGYLYSQGRSLYSRCAAAIYSSPKSALASSTSPAYGTLQSKPFCPFLANVRYFSAPSGSSNVLVVNSDAEFSNALSKSQDGKGLTIVYFTAAWCGPCRTISPIIDNLSTSYSNVTFLKLDIDQENLLDTMKNSQISSVEKAHLGSLYIASDALIEQNKTLVLVQFRLPTFHFYKNGARVADHVGANPNQLKYLIDLYISH